ncbi:hypothetical protein LCGC14_1560980, partial [marine sediment metagenome]
MNQRRKKIDLCWEYSKTLVAEHGRVLETNLGQGHIMTLTYADGHKLIINELCNEVPVSINIRRSAENSYYIDIDSDNDTTTAFFKITKDGEATTLFTLNEDGSVVFSNGLNISSGGVIAGYQKDTDFTAGSVLIRGAAVISQDNANLYWNVGRTQLESNLIKITSDGTQAAPALKFNDTNTGFYKSGDSIRLSINNSTKITIDNDGKVGIGTTNPIRTLDVNGITRISGGGLLVGDVVPGNPANPPEGEVWVMDDDIDVRFILGEGTS